MEKAQKICLELIGSNSEEEVIKILKKYKYWDNNNLWLPYGDDPNNFATAGNQSSSADTALVEKITNSVDAVLMKECLSRGIQPASVKAPKSIGGALEEYFNISDGRLSSLDVATRTSVAGNIALIATGAKSRPCYSIIDKGEGQTPNDMPETLLSLRKGNKQKIHFVQGKFNMGGTGALFFCGDNNIQLIVSKRCSELENLSKDKTFDHWGFTIVRRESPREDMRNSMFTYLAPDKKILSFKSKDGLKAFPGKNPSDPNEYLLWGTYIKLYDYNLAPSLKTVINFDLYNRLSLLVPGIALPVRLYERRKYKGHSLESTLSGLNVRIDEDKRDNVEDGYPSQAQIKVRGMDMSVNIVAFKKNQKEKYTKNDGVIFTINGQAHGFIPKSFFERKSVGMHYISDSLLLIVDCTNFGRRAQEDLFMNSRDRIRSGELFDEIKDKLEQLIKSHTGLRELKERRRNAEVESVLKDSEVLANTLSNIVKRNPTLSKLFIDGARISNPFKTTEAVVEKEFVPVFYPTIFKLEKEFSDNNPKNCPLNTKFRVQYLTNAPNDYIDRDKDSGDFLLKVNGKEVEEYILNFWNGIATLNVELPEGTKADDLLEYKSELIDLSRTNPFSDSFFVKTGKEAKKKSTKNPSNKRREQGKDSKKKNKEKANSGFAMPNIIKVCREDWDGRGFNEYSALEVIDAGEEQGYDFYINIDNTYLQNEIKSSKIDPRLLEARYEYSLVLIGLSVIDHYKNRSKKDKEGVVYERIREFSSAVSPVLLPIIESLKDID